MKHLHSFAPKRLLAAAAAGVLSVCVLLPAGNVLAAETLRVVHVHDDRPQNDRQQQRDIR